LEERKKGFHIGKFEEIDDFPMLWTWFQEDAILEGMGFPRLHTDKDGYFLGNHLWNLLIERIGMEYQKKLRNPQYQKNFPTTIIEFSRGKEHGGYQTAFQHLSEQLLSKAAVLYIDVSWQESLRKNRKRFNPEKPDSILEHSLPDVKLERLYKEVDWMDFSRNNSKYLLVKGIQVPYVVFDNSKDLTTQKGLALKTTLEDAFQKLWQIYSGAR
jgi:hypothetical protein